MLHLWPRTLALPPPESGECPARTWGKEIRDRGRRARDRFEAAGGQEEDFSTNIGGYSLCEELTDEEVTAALTAHEEALSQKAKTYKLQREGKAEFGLSLIHI
eukprot:3810450-Rhodomonas_salina.7